MKLLLSLFILFCAAAIFPQNGDTLTTGTGLKYIILEKGSGEKAAPQKAVEVHYTGMLEDGEVFDSSVKRKQPIEFVLGTEQVIQGWEEGIALMNVGDKFRLIIPPDLGYGNQGAGDVIPPNATLIFDVELISVSEAKTSIADVMLDIILKDSVEVAVYTYHELKKVYPDDYNFKEQQLNMLGYQLLQYGKTKDAIEILKLNAEEYPQSADAFQALAEAYRFSGDNENAIESYKKSLELNPDNEEVRERLQQIDIE
jgi:hypothetical protein